MMEECAIPADAVELGSRPTFYVATTSRKPRETFFPEIIIASARRGH
jgi:hypothetical protein